MENGEHHLHRILAVSGATLAGDVPTFDSETAKALSQAATQQSELSRYQVDMLSGPSQQQLRERIQQYRPTVLYFCQGAHQEGSPVEQGVLQSWQGLCLSVHCQSCQTYCWNVLLTEHTLLP